MAQKQREQISEVFKRKIVTTLKTIHNKTQVINEINPEKASGCDLVTDQTYQEMLQEGYKA